MKNRHTKGQKLLSIVLSLVMAITLFPVISVTLEQKASAASYTIRCTYSCNDGGSIDDQDQGATNGIVVYYPGGSVEMFSWGDIHDAGINEKTIQSTKTISGYPTSLYHKWKNWWSWTGAASINFYITLELYNIYTDQWVVIASAQGSCNDNSGHDLSAACTTYVGSKTFSGDSSVVLPLSGSATKTYSAAFYDIGGGTLPFTWDVNGNAGVNNGTVTFYSSSTDYPVTVKCNCPYNNTNNASENISYPVTAYAPRTVTFKHWSGTVLKTESVVYGGNATPPATPAADITSTTHTMFAGWEGNYTNVTENRTVTATSQGASHTFSNWTVQSAGAGGKHVRSCACGYSETGTHSYTANTTATANCTSTGTKIYTCGTCGDSYTETLPVIADAHNWGDWTRLNDDQHQRVCTINSDHTQEADHNWQQTHEQAVSCTEDGVREYVCGTCGATKSVYEYASGHTWDEGVTTKEATCQETGVKTYTCTKCYAIETEEISKLPHTRGEAVKEVTKEATCMAAEEYNEVVRCTKCQTLISSTLKTGATNPDNHTGNNTESITDEVAATCVSKGSYKRNLVCECGVTVSSETVETEINPNNHTGNNTESKENEVKATCKAGGSYTLVTTCECGVTVSSETVETEINPNNHTGNNTEAISNEVAGTCVTKGSYLRTLTCECGVEVSSETVETEINAENHTNNTHEEKANEVAATCKAGGSYDLQTVCECGAVLASEPKTTGIDPDNHTGNNTETHENEVIGTCVSDGGYTKVLTCECGVVVSREQVNTGKVATNHTGVTHEERANEVAGTCKTSGNYDKLTVCECGTVLGSETVETGKVASNHEGPFATRNAVAPTCSEPGKEADTYCTACDETTETGASINATGQHTYTVFVENVPANCQAKGYDVYQCATCTATTKKNETVAMDLSNHAGPFENVPDVAPTCSKDGKKGVTKCTACGYTANPGVVDPATGVHDYSVLVRSVPATCVAAGYDIYRCRTCTAETRKNEKPVNAANHAGPTEVRGAVAATLESEGYSGDTYCKACGVMIAEGHATEKLDENSAGVCKYCHQIHTGFWGSIVGFFHTIFYFFAHLFGRM